MDVPKFLKPAAKQQGAHAILEVAECVEVAVELALVVLCMHETHVSIRHTLFNDVHSVAKENCVFKTNFLHVLQSHQTALQHSQSNSIAPRKKQPLVNFTILHFFLFQTACFSIDEAIFVAGSILRSRAYGCFSYHRLISLVGHNRVLPISPGCRILSFSSYF